MNPSETFQSESGAMVYMSDDFDVKTSFSTNIFTALVRKIFGGESLFLNTYISKNKGFLGVSPSLPGEIIKINLDKQSVICQSNSYLGSTSDVEIHTKWGGIRSLFSNEGLFWLNIHGRGDLFINSYGAILTIDVEDTYIVDTGHIVAFDSSLSYKVKRFNSSWKSFFFSGEGLTMEFKGRGKIYIQTRVSRGLVNWIMKFLPR